MRFETSDVLLVRRWLIKVGKSLFSGYKEADGPEGGWSSQVKESSK